MGTIWLIWQNHGADNYSDYDLDDALQHGMEGFSNSQYSKQIVSLYVNILKHNTFCCNNSK